VSGRDERIKFANEVSLDLATRASADAKRAVLAVCALVESPTHSAIIALAGANVLVAIAAGYFSRAATQMGKELPIGPATDQALDLLADMIKKTPQEPVDSIYGADPAPPGEPQ
jgi:hypothetical protein